MYSVANYLKQGKGIPEALVEIKFKELNRWCKKNFNHDLSLEAFARMCGRSLSSFKHDSQGLLKQTPGKWLVGRRLDFANSLLVSTKMNISQMCCVSGFKNATHYNRVFKERFQLPPLQFRLSLAKG